MSNQLIKTTEQGKENVFPRTRIQDLFDETSGQKLIDILRSFNMMFVPYLGNKSQTRNQISPELRRQGLWLTYVIDNTVYTEWYDEVAIDDTTWGSDSNWRQGSNALVGDLSVSPNGTWVINGEDSGISIKGDKGDSPVIRIYNNKIQVSYDKGVTYENLNNTPVYTKFRFNSQTNTYQVSYDLGGTWQDISDEKVYHKFRYNSTTNTYQESIDFGKTWSNISAEKVYYQFRYNEETNTHQVSTDLGQNWTDVSSNKVYYQFRTNDNRLQVSTDLGTTWENCSEPIAAWFRWTTLDSNNEIGKIQISRDKKTWEDLSFTFTNKLAIKGWVNSENDLPTNASQGDIYMVGETVPYSMYIKDNNVWKNNGAYTSIEAGITQETGDNQGLVMSQKATTNTINSFNEWKDNDELKKAEITSDGKVISSINNDGVKNDYLPEIKHAPIIFKKKISTQSIQDLDSSINDLSNSKVDKEEGKVLINENIESSLKVINNEEYLEAHTDSQGKFLYGVNEKGDFIIGNVNLLELKQQIDGKIDSKLEKSIYDQYIEDINGGEYSQIFSGNGYVTAIDVSKYSVSRITAENIGSIKGQAQLIGYAYDSNGNLITSYKGDSIISIPELEVGQVWDAFIEFPYNCSKVKFLITKSLGTKYKLTFKVTGPKQYSNLGYPKDITSSFVEQINFYENKELPSYNPFMFNEELDNPIIHDIYTQSDFNTYIRRNNSPIVTELQEHDVVLNIHAGVYNYYVNDAMIYLQNITSNHRFIIRNAGDGEAKMITADHIYSIENAQGVTSTHWYIPYTENIFCEEENHRSTVFQDCTFCTEDSIIFPTELNDELTQDGYFQTTEDIIIVDSNTRQCKLKMSNELSNYIDSISSITDLTNLNAFIMLDVSYGATFSRILKIENGYLYFTNNNPYDLDINYSYNFGGIRARYRIFNFPTSVSSNKYLIKDGKVYFPLSCRKVYHSYNKDLQFFRTTNVSLKQILIDGLSFIGGSGFGVNYFSLLYFIKTGNIVIQNCKFEGVYKENSIYAGNSYYGMGEDILGSAQKSNVLIQDNVFTHLKARAIQTWTKNTIIRRNKVFDVGNIITSNQDCIASYGEKCLISYNHIRNSPMNSIGTLGVANRNYYDDNAWTFIEDNLIDYTDDFKLQKFKRTFMDVAPLYIINFIGHLVIRRNVITGYPAMKGCGIYLDAGSNNVAVYGNIIINIETWRTMFTNNRNDSYETIEGTKYYSTNLLMCNNIIDGAYSMVGNSAVEDNNCYGGANLFIRQGSYKPYNGDNNVDSSVKNIEPDYYDLDSYWNGSEIISKVTLPPYLRKGLLNKYFRTIK